MLNKNSIKSEVHKKFKDLKIIDIKKHRWGLFVVHVKKELPRSTKIGNIYGETDWDKNNITGVVLDDKISWLN